MTKKLDKEHLDAIKELQERFNTNARYLGNISIEQELLNSQLQVLTENKATLLSEFSNLRKQETELLEKLKERYGDGQINITDGTFTPINNGQ
jgi:predicted transcriptional regulator